MINETEIKTKYNVLKQKYDLPTLKYLEDEFDIIDQIKKNEIIPTHLLRFIRRSLADRLFSWISYLHIFTFPNQQSMVLMNEFQKFDEKEKEKLTEYMKEIMIVSRKSIKLELVKKESEDVKLIKEAIETWKNLKPKLLKVVEQNIDIWKKG